MRKAARILIAAALAGCAASGTQHSALSAGQPAAEARVDGVVVQLFREPCALRAAENLRYRATWRARVAPSPPPLSREERGDFSAAPAARDEVFEGCFDVQHQTVVVLYFDDRTIVTLPLAQFGPPGAQPPSLNPQSSILNPDGI